MERDPEAERREDLDRVLDALAAGDAASADRLLDARADPELSRLAAAARQVEGAASVAPPPATRARHVRKLMEEAARLRAPQPVAGSRRGARPGEAPFPLRRLRSRAHGRRRVLAWLAALVAAVLVAAPATAALATNAQPGQPLYGTKLAVEDVRLALQWDPARKMSLRLEFAQQRMAELSNLVAAGRAARVEPAAARLATQQTQIEAALRRLQARGGMTPALAERLATLEEQHLTRLAALSEQLGCNRPVPRTAPCTTLLRAEGRAALVLHRLRARQAPATLGPAGGPPPTFGRNLPPDGKFLPNLRTHDGFGGEQASRRGSW